MEATTVATLITLVISTSFALVSWSRLRRSKRGLCSLRDGVIVENSALMRRLGYEGLAVCPFVFLEGKGFTAKGDPTVALRHERIHIAQTIECGVLPFFVLYLGELAVRWAAISWTASPDETAFSSLRTAYHDVSFEREAWENETERGYLERRPHYAWTSYLLEKRKPGQSNYDDDDGDNDNDDDSTL